MQEYFYNDYALINAVLNDNGMIFEDKKDDKYLQKIKNLDSVNSEEVFIILLHLMIKFGIK